MAKQIIVGSRSETGAVKEVNQDSCFAAAATVCGIPSAILAVADGVSGCIHGEYASAACTEELENWWKEEFPKEAGSREKVLSSLASAFRSANRKVMEIQNNLGGLCASTFSVLLILEKEWFLLHIGDSCIFQLHSGLFGSLDQLSKDHTCVVEQEIDGKLYRKSMLEHYIGEAQEVKYQVENGDVRRGDVFFLCSDGIVKTINDKELKRYLKRYKKDPRGMCSKLVKIALANGETDNITAAAAYCTI